MNQRRVRGKVRALTAALVVVFHVPVMGASASNVIVLGDGVRGAAAAVVRAGGSVEADLGIIDGVAASVPDGSLRALAADPAVRAVLDDPAFRLDGKPGGGGGGAKLKSVAVSAVDAPKAWSAGISGVVGANVAILDSGIAPRDDLVKPSNRIVGWKDFVSGSAAPVDPHGHGTYLAGLVAGNGTLSAGAWKGVAPAAGIVGIRVFDQTGVALGSRIVQGIQWAIDNKNAYGIRVLNMSFSTNSDLSYRFDVVTYAAEQAWKAGIVVVASAGNQGPVPRTILSPGIDPYVVTVGATDDRATTARKDDTMAPWSGTGPTLLDGISKPDLVAPGVNVTSLRVPGSTVDLQNPLSVTDTNYFTGSGTSPATAIVSGVVALLLQKRPGLTPDQVKWVLKHTTVAAPSKSASVAGAGYVNAYNAVVSTSTTADNQGLVPAIGGGLLTLLGVPDVKWRG